MLQRFSERIGMMTAMNTSIIFAISPASAEMSMRGKMKLSSSVARMSSSMPMLTIPVMKQTKFSATPLP